MQVVKLITEDCQDVHFLKEEKPDGKKDYKIRGVFMQADIKNRNGRVYPMEVLTNEVNKYNKNFIQKKSLWRVRSPRRSDCKSGKEHLT